MQQVTTKESMDLTPQARTVLTHLTKHGSLTQAEAGTVYRIRALPRRISDLKEAGYKIRSEHKKDATGQRYVRYYLDKVVQPEVKTEAAPAQKETPVLRKGARVRVIAPWLPQDYATGDEGTVVSELDDCSNTGFQVRFDHFEEADDVYVTRIEVEVIA